jgi:Bacterial Ig-like domain (group 2)
MPRFRFASSWTAGRHIDRALCIGLTAMAVACSEPEFVLPTAPTSTADAATSTTPTIVSSTFTSTLSVRGVRFFSFSVSGTGTVEATIDSITDQRGPAAVDLEVGLGTPSGTECSTASSTRTAGAPVAQLAGTYQPGTYCVRIADPGALTAPIGFRLHLSYPGVLPAPVALSISGTAPTAGSTTQLVATATLADGSSADVTPGSSWTSSDSAVATVAANGMLTGVAPGTVVVTATYGSMSATSEFTVTP